MDTDQFATDLLQSLPSLGTSVLAQALMWVATLTYRCLSYPQRRQTIQRALMSALDTRGRLSYRITDVPQFQPFALEFHDNWWDENCKVKQWYDSLIQAGISTTFSCIRHWKNIDRPFNHEFLEVELEGGRSCILERLGNGRDPDALQWTGCVSRDIIQCFPSTEAVNQFIARKPRKLVIEVTLPRPFDLKDVLGGCYAMKQHANARNYTLQHFNCYFMCCTILSILVRHIASWEDRITLTTWKLIIDGTFADLSLFDPNGLTEKPIEPSTDADTTYQKRSWKNRLPLYLYNPEKNAIPLKLVSQTFEISDYPHSANKYIAVGTCALLDKQTRHPESSTPLLDLLRPRLNDIVYDDLREEISNCLWQESLNPAVLNAIKWHIRRLGTSIENDISNTPDSIKIGDLFGGANEAKFPQDQLDFSSIQADVQRGFFRAFIRICYYHINLTRADYEMETFEGKHPLWKRTMAFILGLLWALLTYPAVVLFPHFILRVFGKLRDDLVILDMCSTFRVNPRLMVRAFPLDILVFQGQYSVLGMFSNKINTDRRQRRAFNWNLHLANGWVEELARILHSFVGSDRPNVPGALAFLNLVLPCHIWVECLLTCVGKAMGECVLKTVTPGDKVIVRLGHRDPEQGPHEWTVDQFQRHILKRIKKHSRRVDNVLLAQDSVVESGITNAMSEIWAALPRDY